MLQFYPQDFQANLCDKCLLKLGETAGKRTRKNKWDMVPKEYMKPEAATHSV
jgi:hypothetical protein